MMGNPIFGNGVPAAPFDAPPSMGGQGAQGGAYAGAQSTLQPYAQGGLNAMSGLQGLENQFDNPEDAYNHFASNYSLSAGAHNKLQTGMDAVRNAMAAHGLSGSGAEAEALTHYTQGVINQDMNDQWNNILNGGKLGLGAGGTLFRGGEQAGTNIAGLQEAQEQQQANQKAQNSSDLWSGIGSAASLLGNFL